MHDDELEVFVRALCRVKARRRCSLRGLATLLGVSPGHLSMILTGKRRPGLRFLRTAIEKLPELRRLLERLYRSSPPQDQASR